MQRWRNNASTYHVPSARSVPKTTVPAETNPRPSCATRLPRRSRARKSQVAGRPNPSRAGHCDAAVTDSSSFSTRPGQGLGGGTCPSSAIHRRTVDLLGPGVRPESIRSVRSISHAFKAAVGAIAQQSMRTKFTALLMSEYPYHFAGAAKAGRNV